MPNLVTEMTRPGWYDPGETSCWKSNGIKRCEVVRRPGWRVAEYRTYDANAPMRQAVRSSCLTNQGFTYKGLRPLRLF